MRFYSQNLYQQPQNAIMSDKKKEKLNVELLFGVEDRTRTDDTWNHNPVL